jgi:hypothetical protein
VAAFQENGAHVLVGTPGRLSDVFERSQLLDPKCLEVLVLDEADRLLDAGYGKHLEALMRRLPKQRRTGALYDSLRPIPALYHPPPLEGMLLSSAGCMLPTPQPVLKPWSMFCCQSSQSWQLPADCPSGTGAAAGCRWAALLWLTVQAGAVILRSGMHCARAGLFSATQTEAVQALARAGLRNQVRVNVAVGPVASSSGRAHGPAPAGARSGAAPSDQRTPAGLVASYLLCESDQKLAQLLHFLQVRAHLGVALACLASWKPILSCGPVHPCQKVLACREILESWSPGIFRIALY